MGSVDAIPPFLRKQIKEQAQNTNGKKPSEPNIPPFLKKNENGEISGSVSETVSEPSPNGIDNIPQSELPSYSAPKETKTKSFLDLDIERQPGFLLTNPELDKPANKYSLRNLYNEAAQKRYDEKLEISKSNIKATPESLSAYNQKRLQEVNKDIQKANNELEGTKGLLAGPQAAHVGGGDRPVKEILDELEKSVAEANQYKVRLKNSVAAEAAKTFIPIALAEGPRFDPTKLARQIVQVADPEQELIFQEAEKGGSTLPGITQANLEMLGLDITEGYVKNQPQTEETAAILKNIEDKRKSFDDRNPELVAQQAREKLGVYFDKKGKGGFFGYSGRSIETAMNDPESDLTPSQKKAVINNILPVENKLFFSTEIPGSGFFRSFKNATEKSLLNTQNTLSGLFGERDDSDRAQDLLNSEVEQSRFRPPGENPTWKQELAYLNSKPELTAEEKAQKVNLEKFVDVRSWNSKLMDGMGDLTGQVAEMALLSKGIGGVGKIALESGGMLSGLTTGAIGTALSNQTVGLFITSYLNAYDNYKTQAIQLMPGDENAANRRAYATVMGGIEGLSERIFNDTKILKAFTKGVAPSVADITNRFINKEITQQVAREELQSTLRQYLKPFGKEFVKSEIQEPTEEAVVDLADGMAQSIFGGQPFDINKTGSKALNTFLTTAINSPLVSGLAAHGAVRQNQTQNAFMKSAIVDMANNPAAYLKSVEDLRLTNQITQDEANEKIQLIKSASKYLKEMPASIPVSKKTEGETTIENKELDYPEASSYLLHRLNEGIVNKQLETNNDEALKPVLESQVKRSVEIRKGIIDGSIGVTPDLEPITDNEKKAQELGIADANTVAPEQLIGTPFAEKQAEIRADEDLIPDSRQTKINELIEQVRSYNDLRKNDKNKSQQLNEIRLAANELGLNFDNKKGYGILKNEAGNRVQTRSSQTNSSEAVDFTDENYSPQTKEQIQNILTDDAALVGLPIKGEDGFRLSDRQKQAALKSIQAGKPTKGAKAIYDFIEGAVKGGNIELEDKTTGKAVQVPVDEYFEMFKEAPQELTDEQIIELNSELGEQAFSEIFDNALNEDYGNDNRNVFEETAQTDETATSENPQAAASGEASTSVGDKTQTKTGVDKYPTRKQFENADQINSQDDANNRLSNGERIFAIPEMDEQPIELRSVEDIAKYTHDQLIAIQRDYDPFAKPQELTKPSIINGNEEKGISAQSEGESEISESSGEESSKEENVKSGEQGGSNTGSVEPPFTSNEFEESEGGFERRFTKQMLRSDELSEAEKGEISKTLKYTRRTNSVSIKEANDVIETVGLSEAQNLVMNDGELHPAVRVVLSQILIKKYSELASKAQDEATKNYYLDKAIQTASFVTEKLGTEAGQSIQAFSLWSRLSPEGQLRAANQDMAAQGKEKIRKRKKDIKVISDKFKNANEEAAEELTKSGEVKKSVEKAVSKGAEKAKEKIQKAKDKRKKLFDKYKGKKGGGLTLSSGGLTKEGIEYVGELVKTYIDEGIANIQLVATEIVNHLKSIGASVSDEVSKNVNDIIKEQFDVSINKKTTKALGDLEKQIQKIVNEHYTVPEEAKTSLINKFIERVGLEKEDAEQLAKEVQTEFDRIATRKKRNILYNEKARFDKINSTLGGEKKPESKTVQSDIIKYSNLGAFDEDEFAEMVASKFGIGEISKEQAAKLIELANKIQKAPEGSPKNNATEDLLNYRAKLKGNDLGETAQAVWYSNVLSGYKTHEKNLVSTFFNSMAELGAEMLKDPKAIPYILAGYTKGVLTRGRVEAAHTIKTGRSPIHIKKIETPNVLERKNFFGGGFNPANWFKYVMRLMVAEDVLSFQGLKEARSYQLARRDAQHQGYNTWSKKGWDRVNEILLHTKERMAEADAQATEEGMKGLEKKRRIYELMENSRPTKMTEDAYGFAAHGTFNHESEGSLGAITNVVAGALDAVSVGGVKPLRFLVPFTRIITNVVNNSLDFTPIGFVRAARGVRGFRSFEGSSLTKSAFKELDKGERQRLIAKAAIGVSLTAILQGLHEAGIITITGAGPDDDKKKQQLMQEGWQPYSVKIGNKWYSYQYTPMVFMTGFLGNMNDAKKYGGTDDVLKQIQIAASRIGGQVVDMTWINSASTFLGALAERNPNSQSKQLSNLFGNTIKGFVPFSGAITQSSQFIQNAFNIPQKQVNNAWQALIQDIPIARNSLDDKINALGDPIVRDNDVVVSTETTDPVWKYLLDKNGWVAPVNKNTIIVFDPELKMDRPVSTNEYYEFSKLRGQKIKEQIQNIIDDGATVVTKGGAVKKTANELTENELNVLLTNIETAATKQTKKEIFEPKEKNRMKIFVNPKR